MKIPKGAKVKKKKARILKISEEFDTIEYVVNVTAKDIAKGEQSRPGTCAIAQALKREFDENNVLVYANDDIKVGGFKAAKLPKEIQKFITDFDDNKKSVKPFSFTIKLKSRD